jgi:translation initiation factor IF-1
MTGKILKGIAGFYYVHGTDENIYECKAKGIFRNKNVKPLVGDDVEFSILDSLEMKGNIDQILPREQHPGSSCRSQCGPGAGDICHHPSGTQLKSAGSFSGYDGSSGGPSKNLF